MINDNQFFLQGQTAAAAAAKSLQWCLTLCDPVDGSPPDSPVPGIFQARTLEWVAISFSNAWKWKVKGKSLSHVRLLAIPWTAAYQALPSMEFSRQEYWSGVPLPSPSKANYYTPNTTSNENDNCFWRERTDQNWWHKKAINDIHFPHIFFTNSSPINSMKIDSLALYFLLFLTKLASKAQCRLPWWLSSKEFACNVADTGSISQEDPLEKEMATHSSLAWEIPWTNGPGGL